MTWTKVDAATGYKVLRAIRLTGRRPSAYTMVGTIAGNTTVTFNDKTVTPATRPYTAETKAYSGSQGVRLRRTTPR